MHAVPSLTECTALSDPVINWEAVLQDQASRGKLFCYRMLGDTHQAEDIYQEACVRLYEGRERFEGQSKPSTYLYRILSNLCLNELRRRQRANQLQARIERAAALRTEDRETRDEHLEDSARMTNALNALPDVQRTALVLKVCEGQSYEEIASVLEIRASHAAVLVYRAKKALRAQLQPETGA